MPEGLALEFSGLTKRFGAVTAVSDFTAHVEPGLVTGFLGPNGAGKTTTLRVLLGLVRPTAGTATIGGQPYAKLKHPLQTVGAVLEASSFHPGRSGAAHLKAYAQAASLPTSRVDEVLGLVGLADAAGRKVGGYSLGMRQRLGLAYALLGDPGVLVLDEPANGLDPEGIKWMRVLLRQLAREGRTVLVSSHLLAEVQQTVDSLLIISQGRLVFQGPLEDLAEPTEHATVVDSLDRPALLAALTAADVPYEILRSGVTIRGIEPARVGAVAAAAGVALSALQQRGPALEEVFLDLVNGVRVHPSAAGATGVGARETDAAPSAAATETPADETASPETTAPEGAEADAAAPEPVPVGPAGAEPAVAAPVAHTEPDELEPEDEAAAADAEAAETSTLSATFDTETGGTPQAAFVSSAIAAAAAAYRDDEPKSYEPAATEAPQETTDAAAEAPSGDEAEAATGEAAASEATTAESEPPQGENQPTADAPPAEPSGPITASFAVASTGVIDIVPPPADSSADSTDETPAEDADVDVEALGEIDDELSNPHEERVFAMPAGGTDDTDLPEDADADVEAIGAIDQELSEPQPSEDEAGAGEASDSSPEVEGEEQRPWGEYVKTEADLEADRFFAAFDEGSEPDEGAGEAPESGDSPPDDTGGGEGESAESQDSRDEHEGGEPR